MMRRPALAVAEDMGELPDAHLAASEQLLHREFGRSVQIAGMYPAIARIVQLGAKGPEVRFEAGAYLQRRRIDLGEALIGEEAAHRGEDAATGEQVAAAGG
jgi:hypothetical protein